MRGERKRSRTEGIQKGPRFDDGNDRPGKKGEGPVRQKLGPPTKKARTQLTSSEKKIPTARNFRLKKVRRLIP